MKRFLLYLSIITALSACSISKSSDVITMDISTLADKIKGAWAGQIVGCTYGGPTEFQYTGFINDSVPIKWDDGCVKWYYDNAPGLYDDVYMDLTFVDVFEKEGLDAPVESFARAFANAGYPLWHANQAARYNILHGIMPPASGHWKNNPHADDIDFQIEADYAGIMSPGLPAAASHFSDEIGHIMNYGDGWYGGVYVANLYSLSFVSDDMEYVVREALKSIPVQSRYHACMADVITWHSRYPEDWHLTWALVNKEYGFDIGCPEGTFSNINIDAVINSAYILIALLYGEKDFARTIDIATRCGQDSDCNPASAAGILATMIGYEALPEEWKRPLEAVADRPFAFTDISFRRACDLSLGQALKVIERYGGKVDGATVTIKRQSPESVRFEQSFEGLWPCPKQYLHKDVDKLGEVSFDGVGVAVRNVMAMAPGYTPLPYEAEVEVYLDGQLSQRVMLPFGTNQFRQEIYFNYDIPAGHHTLSFKWLNPEEGIIIRITELLPYKAKTTAARARTAQEKPKM
ncbi:MAG: ADP-ribosylglycohydrolase family protein [Bacteroidales bacterium]|nr:ADP-ribosylglycohydrolase family protein [Bacteroidales bacterium]